MKHNEVMQSFCYICREEGVKESDRIVGCYDSNRNEKKKHCTDCSDICPTPTTDPSSSLCEKHLDKALKKIKEEQDVEDLCNPQFV